MFGEYLYFSKSTSKDECLFGIAEAIGAKSPQLRPPSLPNPAMTLTFSSGSSALLHPEAIFPHIFPPLSLLLAISPTSAKRVNLPLLEPQLIVSHVPSNPLASTAPRKSTLTNNSKKAASPGRSILSTPKLKTATPPTVSQLPPTCSSTPLAKTTTPRLHQPLRYSAVPGSVAASGNPTTTFVTIRLSP